MEKREVNVFTEKSIPVTYLRFAMPLMCSMLITMVYNLTDTYFVAATGNTDIVAGVALMAPMFVIFMGYGNIFAQGGSSLISRYMGAKNDYAVKQVSSFCFYACLISSFVLSMLLLIFKVPMLHLLGTNDDTYRYAYEYYSVYVLGGVFTAMGFVFANLMRSCGLAAKAMITTISGSILNIILDPLFIIHMGMGAKGAALASILGYLMQDIVSIIILLTVKNELSMSPKYMKLPIEDVKNVIAIGIPTAVTNLMAAFAAALMNQSLLPYGTIKVAAMGISGRVGSVCNLFMSGLTFGGMPVFGYFFGAKDWDNFMKVRRFAIKMICGVALFLTSVMEIFAPQIVRFFIDDPNVIADGTVILRLTVMTVMLAGLSQLCTINFQATGNAKASFLISISRQGIFYAIVLLILRQVVGYYGVLISQPIVDVITLIFATALLRNQFSKIDMTTK